MQMTATLAALITLLSVPASANDLCEGNGYGGAYLQVGPAYLGGVFKHDLGSPNAPFSFVVFSYSDGADHTVHPILGPVCLDVFSPIYDIIVLPTDATGNVHFELGLPAIPSWVQLSPFYSNAVTFEGGQWSSSKTIPLYFENPDSWTPVQQMSQPRMYHTATNLGADGRDDRIKIFVAGGGSAGTATVPDASATTEIFDPLSRSFSAGPAMSVERATHTATRLLDGRILLAGGFDHAGLCHKSCEIYDHATGTLTPTGDMTTARAGHTATLLDDGRVLVTGGFQNYQYPSISWATALSSAQDSAEIYDPATGVWTAVAQPMASKRAGHTATKLHDGTVLIAGGIRGGGIGDPLSGATVPFFTGSVELFDPATQTLSAQANIVPARAFHGASLLPDGRVLVCGGVFTGGGYSEAISSSNCSTWDGSVWSGAGVLPFTTAWHTQTVLPNGKVLLSGGLQATGTTLIARSFTALHDGTSVVEQAGIGLNPGLPGGGILQGRGVSSATLMHDGSLLIFGGTLGDSSTHVVATGYVYTPRP